MRSTEQRDGTDIGAPDREVLRGLPELDPGELAVLTATGEVVVCSGRNLTAYVLDGRRARHAWRAEYDEPPTALVDSPAGVLVAVGASVHRASAEVREQVSRLDGPVRALAAAGGSVFAAVGREGRVGGTLVELDVARRLVLSERALASADVRLTADPAGEHVGIADGATYRTLRARADQPCPPPRAADPTATEPTGPSGRHEPEPCGCGGRKEDPGRPAGEAGHDPARWRDDPPADPCDPGVAGTPTPGGGRVVGDGTGVSTYPPPGRGRTGPCRTHLFFEARTLLSAGAYVVAADPQARATAVLRAGDLSVLSEWTAPRGARLLSSPAAPVLLSYDLGTRLWTRHRLDRITPAAIEAPAIDPALLAPPRTFVGQPMPVLRGGRAPAVGKVRVLVLPVADPGQAFTDGDLPRLSRYLKRTGFDRVREYYAENSFGKLTDITFDVFGVDAGPPGGPLRLPRPIKDYYFPAYVGAHVDLVRKTLPASGRVVFDGRERLTLTVKPQNGGRDTRTFTLEFCAALFVEQHDNFPVQIRFAGTETATIAVTLPSGATTTLNLKFPAKTIAIQNEAELAIRLPELETYLDGVLAAAETAAGLPPRLFARPAVRRLKQPNPGLGYLVTTLRHAVTTGPKLAVTGVGYSGANNPLGVRGDFLGSIAVSAVSTTRLQDYLDFVATLAQEQAGLDYTQRRLDESPVVAITGGALTSSFFIKPEDGGPGATLTAGGAVELADLFETATAVPNTEVTAGRSMTPRDGADGIDGLVDQVFTAAVDRMAPPGQHAARKDQINGFFRDPDHPENSYHSVIVGVVDQAKTDPIDPDFVRPDETWNAGPSSRLDGMRAMEAPRTGVFRPVKEIQFASNWNLVFFSVKTDFAVFCHELGHALGFADLYARQAGYRDDLLYMGNWAMMDSHPLLPHHCGYHKWQAGWITDDRVLTIPPADPQRPTTTEALLVPVEYWPADPGFPGEVSAAFGNPDKVRVVQLVQLDIGGDADVFDLIEARQKGRTDGLPPKFSQSLPEQPAVLVTNCTIWWDENRYAFNERYRAPVHPLHAPAQLKNNGDSFDLAKAVELPEKGIVATVVDRKAVRGIEVFRIKVERTNSAFIDLYFSSSDPYYRNPDLWVDWTGDNGPGGRSSSADPKAAHVYPVGQPVDQGEAVVVPPSGEELHWMVARLRNRGGVAAELVKLNFSVNEPSGGGDHGNFTLKSSVTVPQVPPTKPDQPMIVPGEWRVPPDLKRHTCIMVEVADWKIPRDSDGAALASNDSWEKNNRAQKNVDVVGPRSNSPYGPVEFDFSVNNSARWPEVAYLEPDGLPEGMRLTVAPDRRMIAAGETAIFTCTLELDDRVVDASCHGDRDFRIIVWRVDEHSAVRWGGVHYKVRPRKGTTAELHGGWDYADSVELTGAVTPDPGGGSVRIRLAYDGLDARWVTADLLPGGTFAYREHAPQSRVLHTIAVYEGNARWSECRSPERTVTAPPPLR